MFRDQENPLLPNWRHVPVAYDARAGSVVWSVERIFIVHGGQQPQARDIALV